MLASGLVAGPLTAEIRKLSVLALPLVLGQLAHSGVGFTDTLMVGRLGGLELAGVALGTAVYFFLFIFCSGVLYSVAPSVSQAYGAGRHDSLLLAARQGVWLALFLSIPVTVLLNFSEPLLLATGQDPAVAAIAASYLAAISWGFVPMILTVALRGFLEGTGDTRPLMFILFLGLGVKILLNSVLLTGWGPFPALGVQGAAISSAFVYLTEFIAAALYVTLRYRDLRLLQGLGRPHPVMLRELITVGVPIGVTLGFESGLFTVAAFAMGTFGGAELAAHQIAMASSSMAFNIPLGIGLATGVRVGQNVGRDDREAAARSAFTGVGLAFIIMCVTATVFWQFPQQVVGLFLDLSDPANSEVIGFAVTFIGFAAMFQLADGVQVAASGALRGYKDTTVPMYVSLFSYWVVGLGGGLLLAFTFSMGPSGLWIGLVAGLTVAAALLALRLRWRTSQALSRRIVAA